MFPVPVVNVVILSDPDVDVEDVNPPPGLVIVKLLGYLKITIPEPPALPAYPQPGPGHAAAPPPPPVLAVPAVSSSVLVPPLPPPPSPPIPVVTPEAPVYRPPPPPPPLTTDDPVIVEATQSPP